MRAEDLLVLNFGGFNRRMDALFSRLTDDAALREYFIKDPGTVLDATVFRNFRRTPPNRINQFNLALYSVLSNRKFVAWGAEFQKRIIAQAREANPALEDDWQAVRAYLLNLDRAALHQELVRELPRFMDKEFLSASFLHGKRDYPYPDGPGGGGPDPCDSLDTAVGGGGHPDLGGPCTDPAPPGGPNPIGSTLVAAETAVVVLVVAVFVVAISLIDFTPRVNPAGVSREDVRVALADLQQRMVVHATELRRAERLTGPTD
jgi:hypothetical protein